MCIDHCYIQGYQVSNLCYMQVLWRYNILNKKKNLLDYLGR